jgi:oligopeptide transport system substrate-binding protein
VITDPGQVGVGALGPFELQLTLREPTGHFPSLIATPATYPARLDVIDGDPDWTEPGHFVGNGPYMLLEWVHDHHLTIVKNPNYHGADQVMLEQVTFRILPNLAEQRVAYEDDLLDVSGVPAWELHYILSDPVLSAEFHRTPRPGVYYLGMNTQLTPTNNISVRMALASAIDRGGILTDALNMPWREAATSVIPGGIPGYQNDAVGYTFNPTQAQIYLAQAGFPGGTGFPGVELWANFGNEATIDAVAQSWRDNLGISVTTFYTGFQLYSGLLDACRSDPGTCDYNAYRMGWVMDYADAHNILNDVFHPDSPAQHTGWDDARYRQLIGLALTETNQISRTAYFQEADQILAEQDVAIIPLFFYDNQSLVKSDLLPEYIPFYWGPFYMNWRLVTATSDIITETGGTVGSPDGDVTVEFPDPAVSETVVVTYSAFYLPPHPPTGTFGFAGTGFTLEVTEIASGDEITTFVEPLTITINYTEGALGGQDENTLELMTWNGSAWVSDGITIIERDTLNNRIVALIEHLTEFALFGQHRLFLPVILRHE